MSSSRDELVEEFAAELERAERAGLPWYLAEGLPAFRAAHSEEPLVAALGVLVDEAARRDDGVLKADYEPDWHGAGAVHRAVEWAETGVPAAEIRRWLEVRCVRPAAVRQLLDAGFALDDLVHEGRGGQVAHLYWIEVPSGEAVLQTPAVRDGWAWPEEVPSGEWMAAPVALSEGWVDIDAVVRSIRASGTYVDNPVASADLTDDRGWMVAAALEAMDARDDVPWWRRGDWDWVANDVRAPDLGAVMAALADAAAGSPMRATTVAGRDTPASAVKRAIAWLETGLTPAEIRDWLRVECWRPAVAGTLAGAGGRPAWFVHERHLPPGPGQKVTGPPVLVFDAVAEGMLSPADAVALVSPGLKGALARHIEAANLDEPRAAVSPDGLEPRPGSPADGPPLADHAEPASNAVSLVGQLAAVPEQPSLRPGGGHMLDLEVEVKHPEHGTVLVTVRCWDRDAQDVATFLTKGSLVRVTGELIQEHGADASANDMPPYVLVNAAELDLLDHRLRRAASQAPPEPPGIESA